MPLRYKWYDLGNRKLNGSMEESVLNEDFNETLSSTGETQQVLIN